MMHNISSAQTDADNFYRSDAVTAEKVSFPNQYKMKVGANLFRPKEMKPGEKRPAIIVGHPMGAVKEQAANLYAIKMAERGFVTLAIDLSFWGDSEGEPRNTVSPEIYAEDFSAAADFLGTREFVERSGIGAIGICGSGSFAVSAAKIDPRLKAVATVSMYDMGAASRSGLKNALTLEQRKRILAEAAEQRYAEFTGGETAYTGRRADGKLHPGRTGILRLLPHAARRVHARRGDAPDNHAPYARKQREVHELLPFQRHRDHLAASAALHRRGKRPFARIQRGRLQTGRRAERAVRRT